MKAQSFVHRAVKLAGNGSPEDALSLLDEAVALPNAPGTAHLQRALVLSDLGRADEAVLAAEKAVELSPENPACRVFQGMVLLDAGRISDARDALAEGKALDADNALAAGLTGLADVCEGKFSDAAAQLEKGLIDHSGLIMRLAPALERAAALKKHGPAKTEQEIGRLKKYSLKKKKPSNRSDLPLTTAFASLKAGWGFYFNGKFDKAAGHLGLAAAITTALHGTALFMAGRRDEAVRPVEGVAKAAAAGKIPMTEDVLDACECYGELLFDALDFRGAFDVFSMVDALKDSPIGTRSDYFLGIFEIFSGRRREGRGFIKAMLDGDPNIVIERLKLLLENLK